MSEWMNDLMNGSIDRWMERKPASEPPSQGLSESELLDRRHSRSEWGDDIEGWRREVVGSWLSAILFCESDLVGEARPVAISIEDEVWHTRLSWSTSTTVAAVRILIRRWSNDLPVALDWTRREERRYTVFQRLLVIVVVRRWRGQLLLLRLLLNDSRLSVVPVVIAVSLCVWWSRDIVELRLSCRCGRGNLISFHCGRWWHSEVRVRTDYTWRWWWRLVKIFVSDCIKGLEDEGVRVELHPRWRRRSCCRRWIDVSWEIFNVEHLIELFFHHRHFLNDLLSEECSWGQQPNRSTFQLSDSDSQRKEGWAWANCPFRGGIPHNGESHVL